MSAQYHWFATKLLVKPTDSYQSYMQSYKFEINIKSKGKNLKPYFVLLSKIYIDGQFALHTNQFTKITSLHV